MGNDKLKNNLNIKNVVRGISIILICLFFVPSFMVSCSGISVNMSAANITKGVDLSSGSDIVQSVLGYLGDSDTSSYTSVDAVPVAIIMLLIPIAILVIWFMLKKIQPQIVVLITLIVSAVDLIIWIAASVIISSYAKANYCSSSVLGGFVFTVILLLILIALSIAVMLKKVTIEQSLFEIKQIYVDPKIKNEKFSSTVNTENAEETWICPNCGNIMSDKANFCMKCGDKKPIKNPMFCTECGTELQENAEFCSKCGNKVNTKG